MSDHTLIPRLRTVNFCADWIGVSPIRFYSMIPKAAPRDDNEGGVDGRRPIIPADCVVRLGRRILINEERFAAWLAQGGTADSIPTGWTDEQRAKRAAKRQQLEAGA